MPWEGLDRRKFPRIIYPCLVRIKSAQGVLAFLTHTENIGVGGACVIIRQPIELFSAVDLEIDLVDAQEHLFARGRVVWCVRRMENQDPKPLFYDVGVEFIDLKPEDHARLKDLIERLIKKGGKLLRAYV